MKTDLHVHTYYSDGLLPPDSVVKMAKYNGVKLLSITDHDTSLACTEAAELCAKEGVNFINGIEISAYENGVKLHTLGYGMDLNNPDFKAFLSKLQSNSVHRAESILFKLNVAGVRLSMAEVVRERMSPLAPIHSMHIARAGAKRGYAKSPYAFYSEYLTAGRCAYSELGRPSPEQAVEVIKAAGGFSSLAHPGRVEMPADNLKNLLIRLKACGLGGIEAVYSTHTAKETAYYKELAAELGLLITGGSDTHVETKNRMIGKPYFSPDKALLKIFGLE